jgi:hypothetical protein
MGWSIWNDAIPAALAWMCVWNDLVWWVPFGLILRQVKRAAPKSEPFGTETVCVSSLWE